MGNPEEHFWLEEWKDGRILNPLKKEEIISAINWLVDFQKNTSQEIFKKEDLNDEIQMIRNEIQNNNLLNKIQYKKWIDDYELILENHEVKKSSVHGDFWYANMLYDSKQKIVNLVDWENYKKNGNPFHDLTTFIMRCMMMTDSNQIDAFKKNLISNKKFRNILDEIQKIVNVHYNFSIDFDILLRYLILRNTVKVIDKQGVAYHNYLEMLKILEENRFYKNDVKNKRNWSNK
jgi:thiamine kinase-like enzyme